MQPISMPNLLAFDTSAHICSVALSYEGRITSLHEILERQQANRILPMIDQLLTESGVTLTQLNAIAFSFGPGSFTGIRLAASIAQGLAFASKLPVIPISSCQILAQTACGELNATHVLVALNAHHGEIYWGVYQLDSQGLMQPLIQDQRIKPQDVKVSHEVAWVGVGDGWDLFGDILKQRVRHVTEIYASYYPHAKEMIAISEEKYAKGEIFSADQALPNYLYDAGLWKKQSSNE